MSPLVLGLALAVGAPQAKDPPKKDPPPIVGEWVVERITLNGAPVPAKPRFTYAFAADGKYEVRDDRGKAVQAGTYALDPKKDPAEVDLMTVTPARETWKGIYKVDGDTLTLCTTFDGSVRPTRFEGPAGPNCHGAVCKRVEKKE